MHQAAGLTGRIQQFFTFERIFFLILIVAFILRFSQLDLKLFHHDEAIHSWFSYELLTKSAWQYDPSYHGPFLYFVTAGMFSLFGDSDLVARILPSLFGFLLIPLVFCIYRLGYLDKKQTIVAALFLAISPEIVYFSRFLRHDIFMLFFTLLLIVAFLYYIERGQTRFAVIGAIAAAGGLACKEEMPVILLIFLSFALYCIWKKKITLPDGWKADLLTFTLIVTGILAVLYSGFGGHIDTLIGQDLQLNTTGWYKAIEHWTEMHNQQRLGGPWFYYIGLDLLYEIPIFILAIIGAVQFLLGGSDIAGGIQRVRNILSRRSLALTAGDLAVISRKQLQESAAVFSKNDEFARFCIFWMLLSMAFYAWVGEKVPWLIIHQLLPMIFVAVYRLDTKKIVFAIAGCIFLIIMTWHVAFVPADINEPIVQVQNSEEFREVMQLIDSSDKVVLASKDYWPLPWYYRGHRWDKITFHGDTAELSTLTKDHPGVIILRDSASYPSIDGYDKKTYRLAYWFSYYENADRLLDYYIHRDGKSGSMNIDVFTRQKASA